MKMCYTGGLWVAGILEKKNETIVLTNPRCYIVQGDKHGFVSMPGTPAKAVVKDFNLMYDVSGELVNLYQTRLQEEFELVKKAQESINEAKNQGISSKPESSGDAGTESEKS